MRVMMQTTKADKTMLSKVTHVLHSSSGWLQNNSAICFDFVCFCPSVILDQSMHIISCHIIIAYFSYHNKDRVRSNLQLAGRYKPAMSLDSLEGQHT